MRGRGGDILLVYYYNVKKLRYKYMSYFNIWQIKRRKWSLSKVTTMEGEKYSKVPNLPLKDRQVKT